MVLARAGRDFPDGEFIDAAACVELEEPAVARGVVEKPARTVVAGIDAHIDRVAHGRNEASLGGARGIDGDATRCRVSQVQPVAHQCRSDTDISLYQHAVARRGLRRVIAGANDQVSGDVELVNRLGRRAYTDKTRPSDPETRDIIAGVHDEGRRSVCRAGLCDYIGLRGVRYEQNPGSGEYALRSVEEDGAECAVYRLRETQRLRSHRIPANHRRRFSTLLSTASGRGFCLRLATGNGWLLCWSRSGNTEKRDKYG